MVSKGESYRLDNLLQLRRAEEESAQRALVAAQGALAERCGARDDAAADVDVAQQWLWDAEQRAAQAGPSDAATLLRQRRFVERRSSELAQKRAVAQRAQEEVERAQGVVSQAREDLARCLRAHKALEEHRARWETERRRDADRRQESALDELAGAAHVIKESGT